MVKKIITTAISAVALAAAIQAVPAWAEPDPTNPPNETQEQAPPAAADPTAPEQNTEAQGQIVPPLVQPVAPVVPIEIIEIQKQIEEFETKIQQLDNAIVLSMEKSNKLNEQIAAQQRRIDELKTQIEQAKQDLENRKKRYSERLKSIQAQGKVPIASYAEILLSSKNFSQFLTRFTAISTIIQNDNDMLKSLHEKQGALAEAEVKLHTELTSLNHTKEELTSEQHMIEADKQDIATALAAAQTHLQNLGQEFAAQLAEYQTQLAQQVIGNIGLDQKLLSSLTDQPNSEAVNQIITYAVKFLGVPYVWGGTTPEGFDCSGFTSYVYRSIGIQLPRVSRDQQNSGTKIPLSQIEPGDLVFKGSPAYHVGIYLGSGLYIHAPQTGDVVKIAPFYSEKFTDAVRVLPSITFMIFP